MRAATYAGLLLLCVLVCTHAAGATTNGTTTERWRVAVQSNETVMNPVIDRDVAYVPTNTSVYAVHLFTGAIVWVQRGAGGGYLTLSADAVFLGTTTHVYALSRLDGRMVWSYELPLPSPLPFGPASHARVDYHHSRDTGRELVYATTYNTALLVLDARTGAPTQHSAKLPGLARQQVHFCENLLFFTNANATSQVLSATAVYAPTMEVVWTHGGIESIEVSCELRTVFAKYSTSTKVQTLRAFNAFSGEEQWRAAYPGIRATFDYFYNNGRVFVASSLINDAYPNTLYGVDARTGATQWHRTIGFFYLLAGGDAVFAFGTVTRAKAYAQATGDLLWENNAIAVNDGAVANNIVVFGTQSHIVALTVLNRRG